MAKTPILIEVLENNDGGLLNEWVEEQKTFGRGSAANEGELRQECGEFLKLLSEGVKGGNTDLSSASWGPVKSFLTELSRKRGMRGVSSVDTAIFIFSVKKPLLARLRVAAGNDTDALAHATWQATELFDRLGLYTVEIYQKTREDVISRQQQDMLELSTPVVSLADGILALPLIGTLDSERTQVVMETLLQKIVETESSVAIIDITGVPTVDTLVAQHLLKTITAARLMGADCIISGIRPQIAQTIVHLGVELGGVSTKASLAEAFKVALRARGLFIAKMAAAA